MKMDDFHATDNAPEKSKILLVDDDREVLSMLVELFQDEYEVIVASSGKEAITLSAHHDNLAAAIIDIKMAHMDGITAARELKNIIPDLAIIFHTGHPGNFDEDEIDSSEKPFDYVLKGESISRLKRAVRNAIESYRLRIDNHKSSSLAKSQYGIIGNSQVMRNIYQLIHKVASGDNKILILGETGTGKELVARAIHNSSPRKNKRLAIFNCNHRSPDLVESELFGHIKGSYTGAIADRVGLFEYADKGTVMLDEIGDLDITTQGKILRVLETGEYQRLGSPDVSRTDIRILCATNKDLVAKVAQQSFREDLYYRIKGIQIVLPPLRQRTEDIPLLINFFNERIARQSGRPPIIFEQSAIKALIDYEWPGNVRQLLDTVESLIILSDSDIIMAEDVTSFLGLSSLTSKPTTQNQSLATLVRDFRCRCIKSALKDSDYNIAAAARLMGIDRSNLRKAIQDYGITLVSKTTTD